MFAYRFCCLFQLFNSCRVLVIGGGDGHSLMELLKHKSLAEIQQVGVRNISYCIFRVISSLHS